MNDKADAYVISCRKRQGLQPAVRGPHLFSSTMPVVAFFQCILLKLFEIKGLQSDLEAWSQSYPQKLWATHP